MYKTHDMETPLSKLKVLVVLFLWQRMRTVCPEYSCAHMAGSFVLFAQSDKQASLHCFPPPPANDN